MILTVEELRQFVQTDEPDDMIALRLEAVERMIHGYTGNNFKEFEVDGVIVYPADVKLGAVSLLRWELAHRDKVGVASESISRHSVTYFDMTGDNSTMGFPKALMGFLAPYMKARFGRGVGK